MTKKNETSETTAQCAIQNVSESDYFTLSADKGYAPSQRKDAMQVMECWDKVMTVKCKGGCMTKEYDHFEKVTDLSKYDNVYEYPHQFEDNRYHSR